MPVIKYEDLEEAMQFVSSVSFVDVDAVVSRKTGKFYFLGDESDLDEAPEDVDNETLYVYVPSKLGKLEVWYAYEGEAMRRELCDWARSEGFEVEGV